MITMRSVRVASSILLFVLAVVVAAAAVAHGQQYPIEDADDVNEVIYNNELFPRNSLYGKLQENLMLREHQHEHQQAGISELRQMTNQNTGNNAMMSTNPFVAFFNRLPFLRNPEFTSLLQTYDSCKAPDSEMGLCMGAATCAIKGGRASGTCNLGSVCCINVVSKCSATLTMNNTYWQSPAQAVAPSSTCSVNLRIDQNLPEQKKIPVCQVRLDFISFTIAQPDAASVCSVDTFQASGAQGSTPVICGENNGQHMYLHFESSAKRVTDVQLTFTFGTGTIPRNWNIKMTMIPCGATYAAPENCLQFYTGNSGVIKSFNWIDAVATQRQLANQEYSICIRSELVGGLRANGICYQVCPITAGAGTTNPAAPFRLSGSYANNGVATSFADADCQTDYLVILGAGQDGVAQQADRYCGARFNPLLNGGAAVNVQVCTTARQFRLYYRTDANEATENTATPSTGFCLNYMQRLQ